MAHSFGSQLYIRGIPGLPLSPANHPIPARIDRKNQGSASPVLRCPGRGPATLAFSGFQGSGTRKGARRIQTICGIWFLVVGFSALAATFSSCAIIPGTGTPLELRFTLDPALFIMAEMNPSLPAGESWGKTLAPLESWETVRYTISGVGPAGAVFSKDTTRTSLSLSLAPGSWEITVKALSAASKPVAIAKDNVLLEASRSSSLNLNMLPIEGNGSFSLGLSASLAAPAGSRILGSLSPVDGPAQIAGMPALTVSFPIDVDAGVSSVDISEVPAGFYILDLRLADTRGTLAGTSETVFILAGFETRGSCRLELGTPGITMNIAPLSLEPIGGMVLPVRHTASADRVFQPSLAGTQAGTMLTWKLNGALVGSTTVAAPPAGWPSGLPPFTNCSPLDVSSLPNVARLDVLARDPISGRQGSTGAVYEFASGPYNSSFAWTALYDTRSVTGESLFPGSPGSAPGTDSPAPVKAIASSGKPGILVVAGLDAPSSVHTFHISERGELYRLWKDELRINSTSRTADRLAVSANGRFAAAAGSASNWLRIYFSDEAGRKSASQDFTSSSPGFSGLSYVKALAFSPDSKRLLVLANSPEAIYTIEMPDVPGSPAVLTSRFDIDALYPGTSLGMSALTVSSEGIVAAAAMSSSRVFVFASESAGLSLIQTVDKSLVGSEFSNPMSMAFTRGSSDLHIMCEGKTIVHLARVGPEGMYSLADSAILPLGAESSTAILAEFDAHSGVSSIIATGGAGLVCIPLNAMGAYHGTISILDTGGEDLFGISGAVGSTLAGTTLMMAGPGTCSSVSFVELLSQ